MNKIARFFINMIVVLVAGAAVSYGAFKSQYHPDEADRHSDIEVETITECENVPIYFVPDHECYAEADTQPEAEGFAGYNFIPLSVDAQAAMYTLCQEYEISYELVLAVAKAESGINPDAVSPDGGDFGLCQIHASIWDKVAADNGLYDYRTDPVQNVHMMLIILPSAWSIPAVSLMKPSITIIMEHRMNTYSRMGQVIRRGYIRHMTGCLITYPETDVDSRNNCR